MVVNDVHLIYFSPTGTTEKVLDAVAEGLRPQMVTRHNLTYSLKPCEQRIEGGIALIGVPVYAGRVPESALARLTRFSALDVPAVLIALYGNREFEDALVELRDICTQKGFNVVAAGAFIGEHSYSTPDYPIAAGRPDADDLAQAESFGQQIAKKLVQGDYTQPEIDGQVPYKERVKFGGVAPETDAEVCVLCGQCATACPVHVIRVTDEVTTEAQNCIMCSACLRVCRPGARQFVHPVIGERRELLVKNCSTPKQPILFI